MTMIDSNFITALQTDLAALLAADETHQHVQVIREAAREHPGGANFESAINNTLLGKVPVRGKSGLACIIFAPEGKPQSRSHGGLVCDLQTVVRYVEHTVNNASPSNGTGISAEDMLVESMLLVQNWAPYRGHAFSIEDFGKVEMENPALRAWEFTIKTLETQTGRPKCGLPKITKQEDEAGFTVTVVTATADARLFYTLDGRLPTPDEGIAYETPFEVTGPVTVRAMAWASGFQPSDCANDKIS